MECNVIEIPGVKEQLGLIGQVAIEAGKLFLKGYKAAGDAQVERLKQLMDSLRSDVEGIRVFKDGKDITHRCKVAESDTSVTVDIGCDMDEVLSRLADPMEMTAVYAFRRNNTTGKGESVELHLPKYMLEILNRVLPGSFVDNKISNT